MLSSLLHRIFRKASRVCADLSDRFQPPRPSSTLVTPGMPRSLYRTQQGDLFWLCPSSCVDQSILNTGVWEPASTSIVRQFLRAGHTALDIGGNIGYYSVLMSRQVGAQGRVLTFEPSPSLCEVIRMNLDANGITNVTLCPVGLSDQAGRADLLFGANSATLHFPQGGRPVRTEASVELTSLDAIADSLGLSRLDFVKMDVDGHEPNILRGAMQTIRRFRPLILLEVSHMNYLENHVTAWDFYEYLVGHGFRIYDEAGLTPLTSRTEFLMRCGNFDESRNILLSLDELRV